MSGQETKVEMSKRLYEQTVALIKDDALRNYFKSSCLYYLGDLSRYINSTFDDLQEEAREKYYRAMQYKVNI